MTDPEPRHRRAGAAAAYVLLLVLTTLVTLWGAVLTMLRVGSVAVPVGLALAVLLGPLCWAGGSWTGARLGTAGPALLWGLLVLPMMTNRREGDLIITGSGRGVTYLGLSALSAAVAIAAWAPRASPRAPDSRERLRGGFVAR